jgi:hypothetical protein
MKRLLCLLAATLGLVAALPNCGGAEIASSTPPPPLDDDLPDPADAGTPDWAKNQFDLRADAGPDGASEWCGNGVCNPFAGKLGGETCRTCPEDCGACPKGCGDGHCDRNAGETCSTCPDDCGSCAIKCGDGICNGNETCHTCPDDCGACPPKCGDLKCDPSQGETCSTCPEDCGPCRPGCGDGQCTGTENCYTCARDCGACLTHCNDGRCDPGDGEDCTTCTKDCGNCTTGGRAGPGSLGGIDYGFVSTSNCGDHICNGDETCSSCPQDCFGCAKGCGDGNTAACSDPKSGKNPYTCPQDCGKPTKGTPLPNGVIFGSCGDGVCDDQPTSDPNKPPESCATCYFDCHGNCQPVKGNKICEIGENCHDDPEDCYHGDPNVKPCVPGDKMGTLGCNELCQWYTLPPSGTPLGGGGATCPSGTRDGNSCTGMSNCNVPGGGQCVCVDLNDGGKWHCLSF